MFFATSAPEVLLPGPCVPFPVLGSSLQLPLQLPSVQKSPDCTCLSSPAVQVSGVQELAVFELTGHSLPTLTPYDYATLKHVWQISNKPVNSP